VAAVQKAHEPQSNSDSIGVEAETDANRNVSAEESLPRQRILLLIAYDGSTYGGFQQQENRATIAGELEKAIWQIDPEAGRVIGSSRTDAGVHARSQPVSFTTTRVIRSRGWVHALMPYLPENIAVLYAAKVPDNFDPRRRPLWKRYAYRIFCSEVEDPFLRHRSWRVREPLSLERMRDEARTLVGEHDFAAFRSSKDHRTTTVRHLREVTVNTAADDSRCIEIQVAGDRFMYNMVRIIVGTLVDVGRGKLPPGAMARALASQSRFDLGMTAPPFGLCLDHVELDSFGDEGWPSR
jgi:tRNA pseudouridine38-40 synthase